MRLESDISGSEQEKRYGRIINLDKVNPIKRNVVANILSRIKDNRYIDTVIIFGSSIRNDCRNDSDLDIAVKWTENCFDEDYVLKPFTLPVYESISMETQGNNDVIPIGYEGDLLSDAIKEGVIVYERDHVS